MGECAAMNCDRVSHLARARSGPAGETGIARVAERDLEAPIAKRLYAVPPPIAHVAITLDARVDVAKIPHEARLGIANAA